MKTFDDRKKNVEAYMTKMKRKRRNTLISLTLVVSVLALVLFVPYDATPPSVAEYAGSEYYGVIQRLNAMTYQKPQYKNNFEALLGWLSLNSVKGGHGTAEDMKGGVLGGTIMSPDSAPEVSNTGNYVEVTDNQVAGITEADIFKRSDKYVYYVKSRSLLVYSIEQENSRQVGEFSLDVWPESSADGKMGSSAIGDAEIYLSDDCSTLTLIACCDHYTMGIMTLIVKLDVSDPASISEINRVYFTGSYLSSRMVNGSILLTLNFDFNLAEVDFDDPATFIPQYGTPDNMICLPGNNFVCSENASAARYTVVCKLDGNTLSLDGSAALMGYSQELYVSEDAIFAVHNLNKRDQVNGSSKYRQTAMTEITGISYTGDTLEILGTVTVKGSVRNQYSMDAYEGILRVVTSTSVSDVTETDEGEFTSTTTSIVKRNANLYCIDLQSWRIIAEVIAFAPEGEDAQSVRFDGVNAYVCTADVITFKDPVYFFDLSDLSNITYTDTGTIDGYSTSLIQLGDSYLLGIGYGDDKGLKIEVYEEREGKVVSVCTYERTVSFSLDYKAYLIDRDKRLFGLAQRNPFSGDTEYVLLHFDGYELCKIAHVHPLEGSDIYTTRAFLADGWLYILGYGDPGIYAQKIG